MDREEFAKLIAVACAAYTTELAEETVEIYWQSLQATDYADASRQLKKHIETERFFPRISDLRRQSAGVRFLGVPTDPSKMLPAPPPNIEKVTQWIAKMRARVGAAVNPQPLPKPPAPYKNRVPVAGGCTCDIGSEKVCDYCRWWSATYG